MAPEQEDFLTFADYMTKRTVSAIAIAAVIATFVSCGCAREEAPAGGEGGGGRAYKSVTQWSKPIDIFGFQPENRYAYCPSVLEMEDGSCHMFFCGNPEAGKMVDNIYHIEIKADGTKTAPVSVLQPTPGTWDSYHCCDPSVIRGKFRINGKDYRYAMFYLGIDKGDCKGNEVGVAFSNDLNATEWVKYPKQIVAFPDNRDIAWGVGQPSAFSLDKEGSVLLTYTKGDISGSGVLFCRLDMSDMDKLEIETAKYVSSLGFNIALHNCDFAVDEANNKVVGVLSGTCPNVYPSYIESYNTVAHMPLDSFLEGKGTWTRILDIDHSVTGFYRNHNACVLRDEYGYLKDYRTPSVFYTVSGTAQVAEWSYRIYRLDSVIEKVEVTD